jgi:hypothetical protein
MNSGRYVSVLGNGKGMKKLILVKDIPNIFALHPTQLFDILRLIYEFKYLWLRCSTTMFH